MKKILLFFCFCLSLTPVFAGGVGYVDYEKIFNNYKYAQTSAQEIQQKEIEFRKYLEKKEEEYNKLETPLQRQKFEAVAQREIAVSEKNFVEYKDKKEEDVYNRIHAVCEKIRLEKGLDALLDSRCVFSGGTDITDEVIKKLNENIR